MNKKIVMFIILAVFVLVSISLTSAVTTNTHKKESPLYKIRTRLAIGERIQNIKARFIRDRIFFLPFSEIKQNIPIREILAMKSLHDCTLSPCTEQDCTSDWPCPNH